MNVALFTSVYFNNIGNGFLDLATEFELQEVLPEKANLIKISQCANFAASLGRLFAIKEIPIVKWTWAHLVQNRNARKLHNSAYGTVNTMEVMSPASTFHFDYLVIPGCVLTIHFFKIYMKFLENKVKQGCKLIFIGTSGNYYTDDEISYVSECLSKLHPYAIMTRDRKAFDLYNKYTEHSYNGIDNAFFVNRLDIPRMQSDLDPYVVVNLELQNNEDKKNKLVNELTREKKNIVYTDHCPYPYTKIAKLVKQKNTVISDYPMDYLVLYRNVERVYTDRVHATITTLSFGNEVVLYSDSPRKALLDNANVQYEPGKVLSLNNKDLCELQNKQLEFLKSLFI